MAPWQRYVTGRGRARNVLRRMHSVLQDVCVMKTPVMVVVVMLALLPLPLMVPGKESRCAYVLLMMAVLWLTEALPIPVTALLPVFMFPMTGVLTARDVGHSYFSHMPNTYRVAAPYENRMSPVEGMFADTSMLFIGGLVVAIGVEECNLHKRVALAVLKKVGADPRWIMLGLMLPTWFLSMWISNTATASMMIPIVEAVLVQIKKATGDANEGSVEPERSVTDDCTELEPIAEEQTTFLHENHHAKESEHLQVVSGSPPPQKSDRPEESRGKEEREEKQERHTRLAKALSLSIAYSANVGGIATLTGTPPNLVLKGQVDIFFAKYGLSSPLSFIEWLGLGFPLSLLLLLLCWLWLILVVLRGCCRKTEEREKEAVTATIQREYKALGSITFAELETLLLFCFLALVWISRDPKFMPGWAELFETGYVSDATGAIMVSILFFILPAKLPSVFCWASRDGSQPEKKSYQPLLTWTKTQNKLPWGIIVLLGGGFALAKACKFSGLSMMVGQKLTAFSQLEPWLLNLLICVAVAMATEVTSNVATATLLMPIMAELAIRVQVNPLYLMASSALATSFAFMMPVATPPNAIVFSHGHLTIPDMAKVGFMMNIFAVCVLTIAVNTWGDAIFGFSTLPDAMKNVTAAASP